LKIKLGNWLNAKLRRNVAFTKSQQRGNLNLETMNITNKDAIISTLPCKGVKICAPKAQKKSRNN